MMTKTRIRFPLMKDAVSDTAARAVLVAAGPTLRKWKQLAALCLLVLSFGACADAPLAPELQPSDPAEALPAADFISDLSVASGRPYVAVNGLANGSRVYVDRTYTYENVPSLVQGEVYIRTASGDQGVSGNGNFLSFRLNRPAVVYVASNGSTSQAWLTSRGFTSTGQTLVVAKSRERNEYTIYSRSYSAGTVSLGSNRDGNGSPQMYTVFVKPDEGESAASASTPTGFASVVNGVRPRGFGQGTYSMVHPAQGGTMYYVSTSGSDGNDGSHSAPFRTINKAAQVATAGDVVTIRAGTYRESVYVRNAGTATRPIVFQAAGRATVVLTGGAYNFQPARYHGGVQQSGAVYVTIRGLIFRNYAPITENIARRAAVGAIRGWQIDDCLFEASGYTGLDIRGDSVTVVRSTFQDHHTLALTAVAASGQPLLKSPIFRDIILRHNNVRSDPLAGSVSTKVVKLFRTTGAVVDNIESSENLGPGWWFDTDNTNFTLRNSFLHDNVGGSGRGIFVEVSKAPGLIENNVFSRNSVSGVTIANSAGVTVTGNLFLNNPHSIHLVSAARGSGYALRNVVINRNSFKGWQKASNIHSAGAEIGTPESMNITADHNIYDSGSVSEISYWKHTGWIRSVSDMRSKLGWDLNGRTGTVESPL